jgi:hypothetical protein
MSLIILFMFDFGSIYVTNIMDNNSHFLLVSPEYRTRHRLVQGIHLAKLRLDCLQILNLLKEK